MDVSDILCLNRRSSSDGSIKFLWQLEDQRTVESIYFTFPTREGLALLSAFHRKTGAMWGVLSARPGSNRCAEM